MEQFTESERSIISQFCTNTDKPVFALVNLPEVVCGALFSRYSRSTKSLRRVLLDEFINNPETGFAEVAKFAAGSGNSALVATRKAEEFYERVLVGYGDDSVAELGGAHLAVEDVSNIATKVMQDARIGVSPLEKSTRYVHFNQKTDGKYRYLREERIMQSPFADEYTSAMDLLFDTYSKLNEPLTNAMQEKYPNESQASERAYASSIRAKVCDMLRCLLPASTLTNTGLYGNGRAFEYMLLRMHASPLSEIKATAEGMQSELNLVIPSFVRRANDKYGQATQQYMNETNATVKKTLASYELTENASARPNAAGDATGVELVHYDSDAENKVLAAILFEHSEKSLAQLYSLAQKMPKEEKEKILLAYMGGRANRRQKPSRAFENAHYCFSLCGNFGMYRDLHRHRILTQFRQPLSTQHGFEMPHELIEYGHEKEVREAVETAASLQVRMKEKMPLESQYAVPMGYRLRWYMNMNLREAYHFIELRSMPQGHIDYRRMVQQMYLKIKNVHPVFASGMKFVDMSEGGLERLDAEKKTDKKLEELKKKYGH
ncbi:FAD-dependent thymidylate synthase [Candidatus Micrarchaeota archaeon]|nr:FAD-dependent thymidylate synthase [Candidatus Micrarchaeota archaeon]